MKGSEEIRINTDIHHIIVNECLFFDSYLCFIFLKLFKMIIIIFINQSVQIRKVLWSKLP